MICLRLVQWLLKACHYSTGAINNTDLETPTKFHLPSLIFVFS